MYHVLIVDDDPESNLLLERQLATSKRGRFQVDTACTHAEFQRAIEQGDHDYYFVDYYLPGWPQGSGAGVVRELEARYPAATVAMTSGLATTDMDDEVMQMILEGHCRLVPKSTFEVQPADVLVLQELGLEFRVLAVEDDEDYGMLVEEHLESGSPKRTDVMLAASIEDGLGAMRSRDFDAYVFDYRIPPATVMALLSEMPDSELDKPVVILTSHQPDELCRELLELAARHRIRFLSKKDFNRDSIVDAVFSKRRKIHELFRRVLGRGK